MKFQVILLFSLLAAQQVRAVNLGIHFRINKSAQSVFNDFFLLIKTTANLCYFSPHVEKMLFINLIPRVSVGERK